jgi:hypothetical protein
LEEGGEGRKEEGGRRGGKDEGGRRRRRRCAALLPPTFKNIHMHSKQATWSQSVLDVQVRCSKAIMCKYS